MRDNLSWFCLGEVLEASDRSAAEDAYRKALALNPAHADTYLHFNHAVALEDQGRVSDALASYDAALRLDPDLADAHYNAARLNEQTGDARKAVRHSSAYRRLQR